MQRASDSTVTTTHAAQSVFTWRSWRLERALAPFETIGVFAWVHIREENLARGVDRSRTASARISSRVVPVARNRTTPRTSLNVAAFESLPRRSRATSLCRLCGSKWSVDGTYGCAAIDRTRVPHDWLASFVASVVAVRPAAAISTACKIFLVIHRIRPNERECK